MNHDTVFNTLRGSVIISVQANQGEPLNKEECLLAMAASAINGGAKGLRLANPENIRHVRHYLSEVPIIGITKPPHPLPDPLDHVYITPTLWTAESVIQAGAQIVAMDATHRPRPAGESLSEIVSCLKERFPHALLMADISTLEEGRAAAEMGFHFVGTTLSGYTRETQERAKSGEPDFELLEALIGSVDIPVIMEGRIWVPEQVERAFRLGAFAVVIGSAVTRPQVITRRFVDAIPKTQLHLS